MDKLFLVADRYIKKSDWRDLALIKFCLCAIGIIIGISLPAKHRKPVVFGAMLVFIATYIPLMLKFFGIIAEDGLEQTIEL